MLLKKPVAHVTKELSKMHLSHFLFSSGVFSLVRRRFGENLPKRFNCLPTYFAQLFSLKCCMNRIYAGRVFFRWINSAQLVKVIDIVKFPSFFVSTIYNNIEAELCEILRVF